MRAKHFHVLISILCVTISISTTIDRTKCPLWDFSKDISLVLSSLHGIHIWNGKWVTLFFVEATKIKVRADLIDSRGWR